MIALNHLLTLKGFDGLKQAGPLAIIEIILNQIWSFGAFVVALVNGIGVFVYECYAIVPPIFNQIANFYILFSGYLSKIGETAAQSEDNITEAVNAVNMAPTVGTASIVDIFRYCLNIDAIGEGIQMIVGLGAIWFLILVAFLLGATMLVISGFVVWATRRCVVFLSAGMIDV